MSLLRFPGNPDRGPSGDLWGNIVDWPSGTLKVAGGVVDVDDHFPYNAGREHLSGDSGAAAAVQAVPFGFVRYSASAGTEAVSGYVRNEYIDLTNIKAFCMEARLDSVADANSPKTFVGLSDQEPEAIFDSSGGLDGGSGEDTLGLLWNADETVDLVAVLNSATVVVLYHEVATGIGRTEGPHKFGMKVVRHNATRYTVYASVNGVVKKVHVDSDEIPQVAMRPAVVQAVATSTAPSFDEDWIAVVDGTPA